MKLTVTPDNEIQVWEGANMVGQVSEGDLYAFTDYNNVTQRHLVERDVKRGEVIPALREWFREEHHG